MRTQAQTVIVGAGIVGCSAAAYLANGGEGDIVVVDRGPLFRTGGSTSHAPGLVFQNNASRTVSKLAQWTVETYLEVSAEGDPCYFPVTSLEVATTPARWAEFQDRTMSFYEDRVAERAERMGFTPAAEPLVLPVSARALASGDGRDLGGSEFMEFLLGISPLTHAKRITRPLFVVQGLNDPRVPFTEAEQLVGKVRESGNPVWYLRADNEGHGFERKENADYQFYAMVMFLHFTLMK